MILILKVFFKEKIENDKDSNSLWRSLKYLGLPSKKGKGTASNIGLKIDGELCFEKHVCGWEIRFSLYNSSI